ncbi:unnamed protein product [Didymodactylos carnosus]|uniref:Tetratricopeptide repeat protein n=1 Tax=Didymodactylos carnosus TaxID=1234261 RepID=A0A8S2T770_9BILA|nr:unnamed protein product [Didymodactylos carnosus]CAF4244663.1 unnamed protein product [Didymodactylos carnosus]
MPQTLSAQTEMIEECRQRYKDDPIELRKIDDFAHKYYQEIPRNAVRWYTKDSFLYRLLNEACRTGDIDQIYIFRNFISDFLQQLQELHSEFIDALCGITIKVHRGQAISSNELEHLRQKVGKLYSTNTFLLATDGIEAALAFSGIDSQHPQFESVLFEYTIDTTVKTKRPYADISHISSNKGEKELLFSMGTIFQIDSITQVPMDKETCKNMYWCVKLRLVNENDDVHLASKMGTFLQKIQHTPLLLTLGEIALIRSGVTNDFSKAERYYRLYLDEVMAANDKTDAKDLVRAHTSLAKVCEAKGDYAAAIEYYETVINICLKMSFSSSNREEDYRITKIKWAYNRIASVYQYKTIDYENVIETYRQLLQFLQEQQYFCSICIANTMNTIDDAHKKLTYNWSAALEFYRKAGFLLRGRHYLVELNAYIVGARDKLLFNTIFNQEKVQFEPMASEVF